MVVVSTGLPDGAALQALERRSRHGGSGLGREALIGRWQVERIWAKGRSEPSRAASSALRACHARLTIAPAENGGLRLTNTIALGPLTLCFHGPGQLKGRRPLVVFSFDTVVLSLAASTLWTGALPKPAQGREPFFALIASAAADSGGHWLAARGRGGGLALWVREEDESP